MLIVICLTVLVVLAGRLLKLRAPASPSAASSSSPATPSTLSSARRIVVLRGLRFCEDEPMAAGWICPSGSDAEWSRHLINPLGEPARSLAAALTATALNDDRDLCLCATGWDVDERLSVLEHLRHDAARLLALTGLVSKSSLPADQLSPKSQAALAVARAFSQRPAAVVVDEPCAAGASVESVDAAFKTLRLLSDETGVPVVVLTRDEARAWRYCDRVALPDGFGTPPRRPPARQPVPTESFVTLAVSDHRVAAPAADSQEVA